MNTIVVSDDGDDEESVEEIVSSISMCCNLPHQYGARVELLIHPELEAVLFMKHRYAEKTGRKVKLVNELMLTARYENKSKLLESISLDMYIIVPERLGQRFLYGMDISPGAKTFIEFSYALRLREGLSYQLSEITVGSKKVNLSSNDDKQLVIPMDFLFPVPDVIHCIDELYYRVPFFPDDSGDTGNLTFPRNINNFLEVTMSP